MRLLDVDGEYGCIASWVTPEVSKGGRKVVLHNEFQNTERELDQDEARLLFRMTGDYDPINDRHFLDICNNLWKESYIEKCDIRQHEILHFAALIQENIDEEKGVTGHVKTEADETGEYVTELVCEEAVIEAKRIYKERWRTYNRSTHPGLWTVVLFLLGVILFSLGATFLPRALISVVTNNMEWELSRFIFMILSTVIVFFCGGFLRDLCHGAVGRLFGARVIYKGFLNGSWFTDWYLIDDSVICGKYAPIQKMHIRLAGAYCDMLTMVILSGVLLHTGDAILYSIANGALFGVLIRYSLHFFPFNLLDGWEEVTDVTVMTFDIIKLIIFGANSGYFLYMGASQNSPIYIGVGILLFFAMVGTVGFISGYESLWTLLLIFIVTIPCNIEAAVQLLYNLIYKRYPDSFAMLYVTGFSHKIFRAAFSELSIWQKGFTIITGILILIIMIMAEQYASGLVARLVWPEQKENAFNDLVLTSKADAEQEDDVTMQISWTRKNNYYYSSESAVDDEDVDEKETQEFEWRELALEGDKPVGVIQYRKRLRMSDCSDIAEIDEKEDTE